MKLFKTLAAAVLLVGLFSALVGAESLKSKELSVLEKKLVGTWLGHGACVGDAIFQADGTYHLYGYGPVPSREIGSWKVEWNELPPTLVLEPWPTEGNDSTEPTKVHLVKLKDEEFEFRYLELDRNAGHRRGTETDEAVIRIKILDMGVQRYLGSKRHGDGVKLPPDLKTLVDTKILRSASLLDPWGKEFQYDVAGKRNKGKRPDVWTESKDGKIIGNWLGRE